MPVSSVVPLPLAWATSPVIDYEPAPSTYGEPCAATALLLRPRRTARRPVDPVPPRSAVLFAETALRQIIEVIDRRRPAAQLRPLLTPVLIDRVLARMGASRVGSATQLKVRVRAAGGPAEGSDVHAAEVFATFHRAGRVHAVAARIERYRDRWRIVALEMG